MKVFQFLFSALVWKYQKREVTRAVITLLGVALGVSVVVAIRLANRSVLATFKNSVDKVAGKTNLQVRGNGFPLDESLLESLDWLFPRAEVQPVIRGTLALLRHRGEVLEAYGMDLMQAQATRNYQIQRNPATGSPPGNDLGLVASRSAVLLPVKLAKRLGLGPGDTLLALANDRRVKLKIAGLLADRGLGQAMSGNIALMDIAAAQWVFQKFGKVDEIDLVIRDSKQVPTIQEKLRKELPPEILVEPPEGRTRQVEKMIGAYQMNLAALSWVALFVGLFLVYNTVSISVLRRRKELGIARALGAPKKWIALAFVVESIAIGLLGSALGLGIGWLLAAGSMETVSKTATAFYERVVVGTPALDAQTALAGFLAGLGLSLVAGLVPVHEAVSIAPAEASRTGSRQRLVRQRTWPCAAAGFVCLGAAALAGFQPPIDHKPVFGFLAAALILAGFSLLAPLAIRGAQFALKGVMVRLFGSTGRIAAANLGGSIGRTSVTVAALMTGLAMTVGMGIMIESFRRTVEVWVDQTVKSDLWIKTASSQRIEGRIAPETVRAIEKVRGVKEIDPYRELHISFQGRPVILGSGRFEVAGRYSHLPMKEGGTAAEVFRKVQSPGSCFVSESFADRQGVTAGGLILVNTPRGALHLKVAGVYYEYSNDRGYIMIDRETYVDHFGDDGANVVSVYVQDGQSIDEVRMRIAREVGAGHPLVIRTHARLKSEILRIFDRTFGVTSALQLIAIIVAVLGIVNTQIALVIERKRDIAILRYLGAALRQIRQIVVLESSLLGLVGIALGLAAGFALAAVLIFVINKQSFGWTIQIYLPVAYVFGTSALVFAATILAGLYPASLAARVEAQEALRGE